MNKNKKTLIISSILISVALFASFAIFSDMKTGSMKSKTGQLKITSRKLIIANSYDKDEIIVVENGTITKPQSTSPNDMLFVSANFEVGENDVKNEKRILFKQVCNAGEVGFNIMGNGQWDPATPACQGGELTLRDGMYRATLMPGRNMNLDKAKFKVDYQTKQKDNVDWETVKTETIGG